MKPHLLLLLLTLLNTAHGCLKVNLISEECRCEAVTLDNTNIRNYMKPENPYYGYLGIGTFSKPVLVIDECAGSMYCEDDKSLVVFDNTSLWKGFDLYSADALCNSVDQSWLVSTDPGFTKYSQMWGTCLSLPTTTSTVTTPTTTKTTTQTTTVTTPTTTKTTPTTTITTPTTTKTTPTTTVTTSTTIKTTPTTTLTTTTTTVPYNCSCELKLLNSSTIKDYVDDSNIFYDVLTDKSVKLPQIDGNSCQVLITCDEGYTLVIFDETGLGRETEYFMNATCDPPSQKWNVKRFYNEKLIRFNQIYAICLEDGDGNNSTLVTSTTPTTTVSRNDTPCGPMDAATILFAYSTDLDPEYAWYMWDEFLFQHRQNYSYFFNKFARIRFDTRFEEQIAYFNSWKELNVSVHTNLPDSSLGYQDSSTGSDVLKMLEKFIDSNVTSICGAHILLFLKRYPNELETGKIGEIFRENHVFMIVSSGMPAKSSGGLYSETMFNLATESFGQCFFHDDWKWLLLRLYWFTKPHLFYAVNAEVYGDGEIDLPPLLVPDDYGVQFWTCMTVRVPFDSFDGAVVSWIDPQRNWESNYGIWPGLMIDETTGEHNFYPLIIYITEGLIYPKLKYTFTDNKKHIIQIRFTSELENNFWSPQHTVIVP